MHAKQEYYLKQVDYFKLYNVQGILKLRGCLKFDMGMYIKIWLTFANNLNALMCVN